MSNNDEDDFLTFIKSQNFSYTSDAPLSWGDMVEEEQANKPEPPKEPPKKKKKKPMNKKPEIPVAPKQEIPEAPERGPDHVKFIKIDTKIDPVKLLTKKITLCDKYLDVDNKMVHEARRILIQEAVDSKSLYRLYQYGFIIH